MHQSADACLARASGAHQNGYVAGHLNIVFVATIFIGSFLLFMVEPMFARIVLPRLGGTPAVWITALFFFQTMLFFGYAYANLIARLPPRIQYAAHLAVLAAGSLTLPIAIQDPSAWLARTSPMLWLMTVFALSIGPIFLAVSAQAPLMQAWYARTGRSPYPLYAASNAGSLIALAAYPTLIEPMIGLHLQTLVWAGGYALLFILVVMCMVATRTAPLAVAVPEAPFLSWGTRLRWTMLAAVTSGLLISTTAFLTTDVLAIPLFWVVPLALYLLSLIMAFRSGAGKLDGRLVAVALLLVGGATFQFGSSSAAATAISELAMFFFVAFAIHLQLAREAPAPSQLTHYYLWVALGGMIGGLFSAILAPFIFDWPFEHPLLLVAAAALIPARPVDRRVARWWQQPRTRVVLSLALPAVGLVAAAWLAGVGFPVARGLQGVAAIVILAVTAILTIDRSWQFAVQFALILLGLGGVAELRLSLVERAHTRSFFGVYTVLESAETHLRTLVSGVTLHGAESLNPALATMPSTYYGPTSGVGRVMTAVPRRFGPSASIGVVGLGAGTLACYHRSGQRFTFIEIDPAVVAIARDRFEYLSRCAPDATMRVGDGRLQLAQTPRGTFDVLVIDAFTSDAIPVHLLTREALAADVHTLVPDGLLLLNITNRFVDLEPVLATAVAQAGWAAAEREELVPVVRPGLIDNHSKWVVIARDQAALERTLALLPAGEWRRLNTAPNFRAWTDDYTSVVPLLNKPKP